MCSSEEKNRPRDPNKKLGTYLPISKLPSHEENNKRKSKRIICFTINIMPEHIKHLCVSHLVVIIIRFEKYH